MGRTILQLLTLCREAARAVARNRMRSGLTALGIMIGVGAVVCVVSIGKVGAERAEDQLRKLGDNLVWVEAGSRNVAGTRTGTHGMTNLMPEDADAILREVKLIKAVSVQVDANVGVIAARANWTTHYRGVAPEYLAIRRIEIAEGAPFSDADVEHRANVILLGETVRQKLFGGEKSVGEIVRMNGQPFVVVGVLTPKGPTAEGRDQDDTILLPWTTAQKKLRGGNQAWVDDIMCSAVSAEAVNPAIDRIVPLMRQRHGLGPEQDDDFNIRRPEEVIKAQIQASRTLAIFLLCVASISLLVGGINIMNMMLVAVNERTREIGLRLAVGARGGAVQLQFLAEAVTLSLFGGLCGLLLGVGGSHALALGLEWPMAVPARVLFVAPGVAIAVGVFFGFYPAWKASRLDPIEALRHE